MHADTHAATADLELRIRAKGDEALGLAMAGRTGEARACYAQLAELVAQRPQESVRRMELARGLA